VTPDARLKFTLVRTCLRLFSVAPDPVTRPGVFSTGSAPFLASGVVVSIRTGCRRNFSSPLPNREDRTFARTDDPFVDQVYVRFQVALFNHLAGLAAAALEQHTAGLFFGVRHAGKIDSPEVHLRVQEGHAVGVALAMMAELANNMNSTSCRVQPAKNQFLFCGEHVLRTMPAPCRLSNTVLVCSEKLCPPCRCH